MKSFYNVAYTVSSEKGIPCDHSNSGFICFDESGKMLAMINDGFGERILTKTVFAETPTNACQKMQKWMIMGLDDSYLN